MTKIDPCDTMRNNLIAAALGLQQCTKTAANIVPLPGTERVIVIGTPADVERLLATQSAKQGAQHDLHNGYLSSTMIHGADGSRIVLHYDRSSQAETAHAALCSLIDASQAAPEQADKD